MAQEIEAGAADSVAELFRRRLKHAPPPGTPCANCATELKGPYCHACGQGSDNHKRSILKLLWESVKDFFSFDGRFFRTIPTLFFRPGKLARDYLEGRIARHVPAFRLFLIALVVFILSAEHLVDRIRGDIDREQQRRIVLLSTLEGRAKEAERIRTEAAAERVAELREAAEERTEALQAGRDPAKVEAAYRAQAADAEADYRGSLKYAADTLSGQRQGLSLGADLKVGGRRQGQATMAVGKDQEWLQRGFEAAAANPDYYFMVLFGLGQRLAILLLPILALALGLAYVTKRRYFLFDHLVVAMNLLSFAFLTNAFGFWLPWAVWTWWLWLLAFWTPVNLFQTLRGAYGSSVLGATLKSLFIWTVNGLAFAAFATGATVYAFREMALH